MIFVGSSHHYPYIWDLKQVIMNEYPKVLILGDGLLGSEIYKQTGWDYLSMDKDGFNVISDFYEMGKHIREHFEPDVIVNCIGYTKTYGSDGVAKDLHWKLNYEYVVNLVEFCDTYGYKLVHVSTDYVYANSTMSPPKSETDVPVHQETWYAYCKLLSDGYVQLSDSNHLIIRCSFKPTPFPYESAYFNVHGNFDYVDVIAGQMIELIEEDRDGIWNIGTEYKSIMDLAKRTKPDVIGAASGVLPSIEMDLTKFNNR